VWASGTLYRPTGVSEAGPGLVLAGGAAEWGSRLARLGITVLAPSRSEFTDLSCGVTPATVNTWTVLRGLDFLGSLPSVDRERMGLADLAGDAHAALLAMALDDRPRALLLRCPTTCPPLPDLLRFASLTQLCALPSPRALLLLETETGEADFFMEPLRAVYRLWLQPDRLAGLLLGSEPSPEQEERLTAWIQRELKTGGVGAPPTLPSPQAAPDLPDHRPPGDRGEDGIAEWFRKRVVAQPPQLESKPSRRSYQERTRAGLRELLGLPRPASLDPALGPFGGAAEPGSRLVTFRSEQDVRIPALWMFGEEGPARPAVIAAYPGGMDRALESPLIRAFAAGGWGVLAPDVRFHGEMLPSGSSEMLTWGRREAGMATDDLGACIQWLFEQEDVDFRRILLLGRGELGIPALIAGALDERVAGVIADSGGATYRDNGDLPVIPNILRLADVPQIASLIAPRPLWLYHVPPERVGFSSRRYYDWTRRTYQSLGDEEALKMSPEESPDPAELLAWLEPRLKRQAKRRSF
jgi:hypothetical protein